MSGRCEPNFGRDEILYVSDFEQVHLEPSFWERRCTEDVGDLRHLVIPVMKLVHATHRKEADQITKGPAFEFKALAKVGRRNYGSWKKKPDDAWHRWYEIVGTAFPGYLSWWSVSLSNTSRGYTTHADIQGSIDALKSKKLHVRIPDYLKMKPESIYGGLAFECEFMDLLASYIKSRSPKDSKKSISDICIRVGGTLTYRFEICYVLIVSTIDDSDALSDYSLLTDSDLFHTNGLVDGEGRINTTVDKETCLTFHPKHNVAWVAGRSCSYEKAAFAFYFKEEDQVLTVDSQHCNEQLIIHNKENCVKNYKRRIRCPDR